MLAKFIVGDEKQMLMQANLEEGSAKTYEAIAQRMRKEFGQMKLEVLSVLGFTQKKGRGAWLSSQRTVPPSIPGWEVFTNPDGKYLSPGLP
jgi:hypothetical protein